MVHEISTNLWLLQYFVTFTQNKVDETQLFDKKRFQGFISEILKMVNFLGESSVLGLPRFQELSNLLFIFMLSFQDNLNYASSSRIGQVMEFYNEGNKIFETDSG